MTERYVTLLGAEQVDAAASRMRSAADEMNRAAGNMVHALQQHERFMDDWLQRFTAAIEDREIKIAITADGKGGGSSGSVLTVEDHPTKPI